MIATTAFDREIENLLRPGVPARGASRFATRLGVALVKWGRKRAVRASLSHEEQARRIETERSVIASRDVPGIAQRLF